MKIQSLAVIFIIIILPISMVLNVYIQNQVQTLSLQISYDTKLNNATYDALKAFQLNTINNSTSDLSNSKIRDIEASANSFFNSISSNFNMVGYNQDILKEYVPALVYTMYDGYYIYSSYTNNISEDEVGTYKKDEKIYGLKPYIHYSCRYVNATTDCIITYTLDNYITINGLVNGNYVTDSGYLLDYNNIQTNEPEKKITYRGVEITEETPLSENMLNNNQTELKKYNYVKVNGVKYYYDDDEDKWFSIINNERYYQKDFKEEYNNYNDCAYRYYKEGYDFTKKVFEDYGLGSLKTVDIQDEEIKSNTHINNNDSLFKLENIEEPDSNFNQHRLAVIRTSIEKNLSIAIANYNNYGTNVKANFQMPKLQEDEWDKIINHVSIISFLQGLNIGGKIYNGYSIITNTKNKEVVAEDSIYIVGSDGVYYHNVKEEELEDKVNINSSIGLLNIDFERTTLTNDNGSKHFFPRDELGSYESIVNQTNVESNDNIYKYLSKDNKEKLPKIYYTALGRERYSMYRTNNNAEELLKYFQVE